MDSVFPKRDSITGADDHSGTIFRIKRFALHDGPGIRTTVFLKGCPLSCAWCHNPEGQSFKPQTMAGGPATGDRPQTIGWRARVSEIVQQVEKDLIFYDDSGGGVTFSGGEPLAQPRFLMALLKICHSRGLHTVVDTSGYCNQDIFLAAAKLCDLVLFDLKVIDPLMHRMYTGVDNHLVLANFIAATKARIAMRVRLPLVPGISANSENLEMLAEFLNSTGSMYPVDILPYHRIGHEKYRRLGLCESDKKIKHLDSKQIEQARLLLAGHGISAFIGG